MNRIIIFVSMMIMLQACEYTRSKFQAIGRTPVLTEVTDPKISEVEKKVEWSSQGDQFNKGVNKPQTKYANSLWQPGERYFFRDQRARRVGDILKVTVEIADNATFDNSTEEKRDSSESLGVPNLFGIEKALTKKGRLDVNNLASITGSHSATGSGKTTRKESIKTEVAAMVTQILPNGNLVIRGSQEVRVNFDVREVTVAGIVRPEDITADNSIDSKQIAEARISYGGRGHIQNMQQPRVGTQILDAFSPF